MAIKRAGKDKTGRALWLCKCDCGNTVTATLSLIEDYNINIAISARAEAEKAVKSGVFDDWILKLKEDRKNGKNN